MFAHSIFNSFLLLTLTNVAMAAYSASGHNVAMYWGQGAGQKRLSYYCDSSNADAYADIIMVSFLDNFSGSTASFNFGNACASDSSCTEIAEDIKTCQSKGVKVLLSMGGADGSYGISGSSDASELVETLYKMFGPSGTVFPGAEVDGFDLDIEQGTHTGYSEFISAVKTKFGSDFLISAAPQCVFPDASIGEALDKAQIDIAFIQFYNNYCSLDKTFNWDTWTKAVTSTFANKNMKLYIGLPGSSSSAGSGYVSLSTVKSKAAKALTNSNFGGFMFWEASTVSENTGFVSGIRSFMGSSSSNSASTTTTGTSSSTQSSSAAHKKDSQHHIIVTTTAKAVTSKVTTTISPSQATSDDSAAAASSYTSESLATNVLWAVTTTYATPTLQTNVLWAVTSSASA
ncbi:hypothetical protein DASC09_036120 [Saccharomycopsis crataegensis]|uniref:chitinase n=1 Tax=Saccharomycopsis crataegensis TaxID=43959 RepID=A0AAV5QNX1_9ASCO|nr:hypothetical protein DASC09_036120 [Saccharomycopsis crataegensis]